MKTLKQILILSFTMIFGMLIIAAFLALPIMLLWNWLMPLLFGLTKITFIQAFGLMFLSGLLFKNTSQSK